MFIIEERVNLRTSSLRHKLIIEVDKLIDSDKSFIFTETGGDNSRNRMVVCELYNKKKEVVLTFSSSMASYGDALRHIGRQIKHYNSTRVNYYTGVRVNAAKLTR